MKISKAEFIISAVSPSQYPAYAEPELVLAGRSNVGKSSLINKILGRKNLARTSSQPGKTRTLNFYHINDSWYFVDLPGYGYAKVAKDTHAEWEKFINKYLTDRPQIRGIILLLDIRHPPSKEDVMMYEWLIRHGIPFCIVATKADKISRGQWQRHKDVILCKLLAPPDTLLIIFSAESGVGAEEVNAWLEGRLGSHSQ